MLHIHIRIVIHLVRNPENLDKNSNQMVPFPRVEGSDYRLTVGGFSGTAGDTLRFVDIRPKILEREIVHTPPYHSGNAGDTLRL